jgi:cephalosporin hydroxylase
MDRDEFEKLYHLPADNKCDAGLSYGQWMQQHPDEFWDLLTVLNPIEPKIIVEIGVNHGGSTVFWDHLVGPDGVTIAIDILQGEIMSMFRPEFCSYAPVSDLHLINGDSHKYGTLAEVKKILNGRLVDFLFIDGDHSYSGCKLDYEMYSPLVREGGIIGLDDVSEPYQPYWDEITEPKKMFEVKHHGLGVVYK